MQKLVKRKCFGDRLALKLFKHNAGVMSTKAKSIAHCYLHLSLLCFIEGEIQLVVQVRVIIEVVDGWLEESHLL